MRTYACIVDLVDEVLLVPPGRLARAIGLRAIKPDTNLSLRIAMQWPCTDTRDQRGVLSGLVK